jgi:hypothetical protein
LWHPGKTDPRRQIVIDKMHLMYRLSPENNHRERRQASPYKETKMFQVTEKASEMIKEFLKDKPGPHSIRVLMSAGG